MGSINRSEIDDFLAKVDDVSKQIDALRWEDQTGLEHTSTHVDNSTTCSDGNKKSEDTAPSKIAQDYSRHVSDSIVRSSDPSVWDQSCERWWMHARLEFGDADVNDWDLEAQPKSKLTETTGKEQRELDGKHIVRSRDFKTNGIDYSKWENWTPNDPVSLEEAALVQAKREQLQDEAFEKANPQFCAQFKEDMERRKAHQARRKDEANRLRDRGNSCFKLNDLTQALYFYEQALEKNPFSVQALCNLAQVCLKLEIPRKALEFSRRACFVDPGLAKAHFRRARAYKSLDCESEYLSALRYAVKCDPMNRVLLDELLTAAAVVQEQDTITNGSAKLNCDPYTVSEQNNCHKLTDHLQKLHYLVMENKTLPASDIIVVRTIVNALLRTHLSCSMEQKRSLSVWFRREGTLSSVFDLFEAISNHAATVSKPQRSKLNVDFFDALADLTYHCVECSDLNLITLVKESRFVNGSAVIARLSLKTSDALAKRFSGVAQFYVKLFHLVFVSTGVITKGKEDLLKECHVWLPSLVQLLTGFRKAMNISAVSNLPSRFMEAPIQCVSSISRLLTFIFRELPNTSTAWGHLQQYLADALSTQFTSDVLQEQCKWVLFILQIARNTILAKEIELSFLQATAENVVSSLTVFSHHEKFRAVLGTEELITCTHEIFGTACAQLPERWDTVRGGLFSFLTNSCISNNSLISRFASSNSLAALIQCLTYPLKTCSDIHNQSTHNARNWIVLRRAGQFLARLCHLQTICEMIRLPCTFEKLANMLVFSSKQIEYQGISTTNSKVCETLDCCDAIGRVLAYALAKSTCETKLRVQLCEIIVDCGGFLEACRMIDGFTRNSKQLKTCLKCFDVDHRAIGLGNILNVILACLDLKSATCGDCTATIMAVIKQRWVCEALVEVVKQAGDVPKTAGLRKNAALCLGRLSKDPTCLSHIRDVDGTKVLLQLSKHIL